MRDVLPFGISENFHAKQSIRTIKPVVSTKRDPFWFVVICVFAIGAVAASFIV